MPGRRRLAQELRVHYVRSASFDGYRTYGWIDYKAGHLGDRILDQNIKRVVDAQFAGKGLRRVDCGRDILAGYQAAISHEK
jgi:hypothetical protein